MILIFFLQLRMFAWKWMATSFTTNKPRRTRQSRASTHSGTRLVVLLLNDRMQVAPRSETKETERKRQMCRAGVQAT